jgi:hypothetical protein
VPTVGVWGVGRVYVELFPLGVGVLSEPMGVPPVHGVAGALSWHSVQLTVPRGAPPAELPTAVAVSPQGLPTAVAVGGRIAVMSPGVAAVTVRHSAGSAVPARLSSEPWYRDAVAGV